MFQDTPSLYALRSSQVPSVHYSMMSSERSALVPVGCPARLARSPFAHLPTFPPSAVRLAPVATPGGSRSLDPLHASRLPSIAVTLSPGSGLDRPLSNAVRFLSSHPRVLFSPGGGWGWGVSSASLFPRHAPGARRQESALCALRSALGTPTGSTFVSIHYSCDSINRFNPQTSLPSLTWYEALIMLTLYARPALQAALYPLSEMDKRGPYRFWRYDCIARPEQALERPSMQFWTFEHAVDRPTGSILPEMTDRSSLARMGSAVLLERFPLPWSVTWRPGRAATLRALPYHHAAMIPYSLQKKVVALFCQLSPQHVPLVPFMLWPSSLRPVGDTEHFRHCSHQDTRGVKKMPFTDVRRRKPLTHPLHSNAVSALKRLLALVLSCADVPHYKADGVKGGIFSRWCHDSTVTSSVLGTSSCQSLLFLWYLILSGKPVLRRYVHA